MDNLELELKKAGELYLEGDHVAAREEIDKVLAVHPSYAEAWLMKGQLLAADGREDEAISVFEKALSLSPHNLTVQMEMSEALWMKNEHSSSLGRAAECIPDAIERLGETINNFTRLTVFASDEKRLEVLRAASDHLGSLSEETRNQLSESLKSLKRGK